MAIVDWIEQGSRIYLDANVIVYFIERRDRLQQMVADVLAAGAQAKCRFVTSEAGVAECLYEAFKIGSAELEDRYRRFFGDDTLLDVTPVDGGSLVRAARFGAEAKMKLLDALHVTSAIDADCRHLLTNDDGMTGKGRMDVVRLRML